MNRMSIAVSFAFLSVSLLYPVNSALADQALAEIKSTTGASKIKGIVLFKEVPEGLETNIFIGGLAEGEHGFHIHEKGECSDEGKAAGDHFNPHQAAHGLLRLDGVEAAHLGDLGNIRAISDGTASVSYLTPGLKLKDPKTGIVGRSVIVHEKKDDFSQPAGNAGARIACGVIRMADDQETGELWDRMLTEVSAEAAAPPAPATLTATVPAAAQAVAEPAAGLPQTVQAPQETNPAAPQAKKAKKRWF